ncbi:sce7726 family protein [Eubacterium sp.]|uniref:sce7726 family protein n=1 Tax=Eubacterium sp. TaxID=142586 RepID=UPI0025D2F4C8|nr:sce7726 family protein [Eubacterium sp.]MCR5629099.1 sce7726 family protein [Eubacterium sp.]
MLYDKNIREPLFDFLDEIYGTNRTLEELMIGKSRADICMITKENIIGIEIKSDADTYVRLKRQVRDYNKYFDMNIVVCGSSHGNHIKEHVPDNWGIITVEETDVNQNDSADSSKSLLSTSCDFYILREPATNPKVTMLNKLSLLWRPELVEIKDKYNLPKYDYLSKANLILKMEEKIDHELLQKDICEALLERDYNTIGEKIAEYHKSKNITRRQNVKTAVKRKRRSRKKATSR